MPQYADLDQLLEKYNFENVHKVMTMLNWTWAGKGVPTIEDMKGTVAYLFNELMRNKKNPTYASTGGFHLELKGDYLTLTFQLEKYSHYFGN